MIGSKLSQYRKKSRRGFTMIDLTAILSVSALIIAGSLQWLAPAAISDAEKARITYKRMQTISDAIITFSVTNKRLPCPAAPNIRSDNKLAGGGAAAFDFGEEAMTFSVADGNDCSNSVGVVPVRSLALTDDYIVDAWGKRITYHVSPNLCGDDDDVVGILAAQKPFSGCTQRDYEYGIDPNAENALGNLIVTDGTTNITTVAAFVLVSHGANGLGAYLPSGLQLAGSAGNEAENADADTTYVKRSLASNYDDIVLFRTKAKAVNLARSYTDLLISIDECNANSTVLQSLTKNIADDMDTHIDDYRIELVDGGGEYYNTGSQVAMGLMWNIQEICSHADYYGEAASGDWLGKKCPGGGTLTGGVCVCANGEWDGSC